MLCFVAARFVDVGASFGAPLFLYPKIFNGGVLMSVITAGTIKSGNTLAFYIDLADGDDPIVGASLKLSSQVRSSTDKLLADLDITEVEGAPGRYLLRAATDKSWTSPVFCDIQYADGGVITSTQTFQFIVEKAITHD